MKKTSKEKQMLDDFISKYSDRPSPTRIEREYIFHDTRKWRFDYAFIDHLVAVEYEGGVFFKTTKKSGHTTGIGFTKNCEKYNEAQLLGWIVLRFTAPMIRAKQHETDIFWALRRKV